MTEENQEQLTQEDLATLQQYANAQYAQPEEKVGLFHFFKHILSTKDTTKVGNLDIEELNSVRNLQRAKLFADKMGYDLVADYLNQRSEIILGTSLSKDAALIQAAITSKKESKAMIKSGESKKKWLSNKTETQQVG